ncbi:hypothetical protein F5887DRAFT_962452 [Amanita rubescens]|nr:hypothetical protein F5887DRAFT_962452 [Amanita rubescens]
MNLTYSWPERPYLGNFYFLITRHFIGASFLRHRVGCQHRRLILYTYEATSPNSTRIRRRKRGSSQLGRVITRGYARLLHLLCIDLIYFGTGLRDAQTSPSLKASIDCIWKKKREEGHRNRAPYSAVPTRCLWQGARVTSLSEYEKEAARSYNSVAEVETFRIPQCKCVFQTIDR